MLEAFLVILAWDQTEQEAGVIESHSHASGMWTGLGGEWSQALQSLQRRLRLGSLDVLLCNGLFRELSSSHIGPLPFSSSALQP